VYIEYTSVFDVGMCVHIYIYVFDVGMCVHRNVNMCVYRLGVCIYICIRCEYMGFVCIYIYMRSMWVCVYIYMCIRCEFVCI